MSRARETRTYTSYSTSILYIYTGPRPVRTSSTRSATHMHGQRASNEALVLVLVLVTPTAPRKLNSIKARMRPQKEQSLLQQDRYRRREYYFIHLVLGASDRELEY